MKCKYNAIPLYYCPIFRLMAHFVFVRHAATTLPDFQQRRPRLYSTQIGIGWNPSRKEIEVDCAELLRIHKQYFASNPTAKKEKVIVQPEAHKKLTKYAESTKSFKDYGEQVGILLLHCYYCY